VRNLEKFEMITAMAALLVLPAGLILASPPHSEMVNSVESGADPNQVSDYRVGAGDLLEISVFSVSGFQHFVRVSSSGFVKLPLLGQIHVAGRTCAEIEDLLTKKLDGEYINDPDVIVQVKEYRSQSVLVLGAVRSPGLYQLTHDLTLVDVLALAGGVTVDAGDTVTIQRRAVRPEGGQQASPQLTEVNLEELIANGNTVVNLPVYGGDVINVVQRVQEVYYVIGEVNSSGAFPLRRVEPLRISQALAQAGGPQKTAKMSKSVLLRYDEKGERKEIPVDFAAILQGRQPDFNVLPNDIIFVPGSHFKNVTYGILGIIPHTVSTVPHVIR